MMVTHTGSKRIPVTECRHGFWELALQSIAHVLVRCRGHKPDKSHSTAPADTPAHVLSFAVILACISTDERKLLSNSMSCDTGNSIIYVFAVLRR